MSALVEKLERLLRHHRQRVFDPNGAAHARAIRRLKATRTARDDYQKRADATRHRASERALRLWQ